MKRYYYTDPLAAAWMVTHHNFHFESGQRSPLYFDGDIFRRQKDSQPYTGSKFYVANNALRAGAEIEPRGHDLITFVCDDGSIAVDAVETVYEPSDEGYPYTGNGYESVLHLCASHPDWIHASRAKVIQRNSIPFMWPESEEVE